MDEETAKKIDKTLDSNLSVREGSALVLPSLQRCYMKDAARLWGPYDCIGGQGSR